MSDWERVILIGSAMPVISPLNVCSVLAATGSFGAPGSGTWPSANRAIYVPFRLGMPYLVRFLFCLNGATVSGNVDVGVYDEKGTRLVSAGSTVQSGTTAIQTFNVTDTLLSEGVYYMALALSNTTGTFRRVSGIITGELRGLGVVDQDSAFPLPATATLSTPGSAYLPLFGVASRTVL